MLYTIQNDHVSAQMDTRGAELKSLRLLDTDREYLWQGAPETWPNHSLLLFPACGRVADSRMLVDGREYPLMMHGFAKDAEFRCVEHHSDYVVFELTSSYATRAMFPYEFRFRVCFRAVEDRIEQRFELLNEGDRTMFFSLGAHPGFFCPIVLGEKADRYVMRFNAPQHIREIVKDPATWLLTHESTAFLEGDTVPLSDHFFDNGPMILENVNAASVTLLSLDSGRFVEMGIQDFPYMCLWGKGGRMQIICIEPWCGISDYVDTDHQWEKRPGNEQVAPHETFVRTLTFRMG